MKRIVSSNALPLLVITVLALFLRLYKVDQIPPSLSWDEVSIGYNAYSILKTGFDEHHRYLPLDTFVAYGDYKPPLPIYLTVPGVAIFGLTEFAVRLPAVIAGTLTVLFTYFLVLELFGPKGRILALVTSFFMAVSPWHMQLSRAGFEATIALLFIVIGVWLTLLVAKRPSMLLVCWLPFVAAVYTFNSARYFVPLLGLGLLFYTKSAIAKKPKQLFIGLIIASIGLLPIAPHLVSKEAKLRFAEVNIFSDISIVKTANERIVYAGNTWWARILNNRRIGYARSFAIHFIDHFQPRFLFITGDGNPKFSLQDVGQLYLIEAPFLVLGFFWLLKQHPKIGWFTLWWLVAAVIPAATARETPHALRTLNTLPVWQIWIAFGIVRMVESAKGMKKAISVVLLGSIYIGSIAYFSHLYFVHYAKEFSGEWQYGYREAIRYAESVKGRYQKIVMTDYIGRPYMYAAFYGRYDPQLLWDSNKRYFDAAGFYHVDGFEKYEFVRGAPSMLNSNTLYILDPYNIQIYNRAYIPVNRLNGTPALVIYN